MINDNTNVGDDAYTEEKTSCIKSRLPLLLWWCVAMISQGARRDGPQLPHVLQAVCGLCVTPGRRQLHLRALQRRPRLRGGYRHPEWVVRLLRAFSVLFLLSLSLPICPIFHPFSFSPFSSFLFSLNFPRFPFISIKLLPIFYFFPSIPFFFHSGSMSFQYTSSCCLVPVMH